MKVRLTGSGWAKFTGMFGQVPFVDGVSVNDLLPYQIARIGAATTIEDAEGGNQVGPAASILERYQQDVPAAIEPVKLLDEVKAEQEVDRARLAKEEAERKAAEKAAFAEAQEKAEQAVEEIVIYSRTELEAIGSNDGVIGLRNIADKLGVKGRSITDLVKVILDAQAKLSVV